MYIHILQHTATHCNTLQHTATYCNTHDMPHVMMFRIFERVFLSVAAWFVGTMDFNLRVCLFLHLCIHTYMYIRKISIGVFIYTYIHVCLYMCIYRSLLYIYMYKHIYTCRYIHIYTCIHVCI